MLEIRALGVGLFFCYITESFNIGIFLSSVLY